MRSPQLPSPAELLALCDEPGVAPTFSWSQLEAETIHRGVALSPVLRQRLLDRLREEGVL